MSDKEHPLFLGREDDKDLWEKRFLSLGEVTGATQDQIREAFDKAPSKMKAQFKEWLSPESEDFMGSGVNLQEFMVLGRVGKMRVTYGNQDRKEQKRRLDLIIRASHELEEIRKVSIQATAFAEMAIGAIITGETTLLKVEDTLFLCFPEEDPRREEYLNLWKPLLEILGEARETWPKNMQDPLG